MPLMSKKSHKKNRNLTKLQSGYFSRNPPPSGDFGGKQGGGGLRNINDFQTKVYKTQYKYPCQEYTLLFSITENILTYHILIYNGL